MHSLTRTQLLTGLLLMLCLSSAACDETAPSLESATIGGHPREWLVHMPAGREAGRPLPLVIAFHGHGSSAAGMERLTGLDRVADQQGFMVVYPSGIDRSWAAGIGTPADEAGVDDVAFTAALLDRLEKEYPIDTRHIVLTGFSNGAHMVQLLGCRLAGRITAIVPVSGTLGTEAVAGCHPARPLSVIEFHGTADPIDPYAGGSIKSRGISGSVQPVDAAIADWARRDQCQGAAVESKTGASDASMPVLQRDFLGCAAGVQVRLYAIGGAGHTWPGGPQYLPERWIGKATKAINASAIIGEMAAAPTPPHR